MALGGKPGGVVELDAIAAELWRSTGTAPSLKATRRGRVATALDEIKQVRLFKVLYRSDRFVALEKIGRDRFYTGLDEIDADLRYAPEIPGRMLKVPFIVIHSRIDGVWGTPIASDILAAVAVASGGGDWHHLVRLVEMLQLLDDPHPLLVVVSNFYHGETRGLADELPEALGWPHLDRDVAKALAKLINTLNDLEQALRQSTVRDLISYLETTRFVEFVDGPLVIPGTRDDVERIKDFLEPFEEVDEALDAIQAAISSSKRGRRPKS
jgi:hypothetical protein